MSCMSFMPWPDELGGRVPGNEGTEGIVGCSAMVVIAGGIEVLKEEEKDGESDDDRSEEYNSEEFEEFESDSPSVATPHIDTKAQLSSKDHLGMVVF